jgi:DNA-binding transcriptional MerR regulator
MNQLYTRQEVITITQCSASRLAYLDRLELVIPQRPKSGIALYTDAQMQQIQLINAASEHLHHATIQLAIERDCLAELVAAIANVLSASTQTQRRA